MTCVRTIGQNVACTFSHTANGRADKADRESMCDPAGQADLLNRAGSELNILCGLCVGHDAIFSMVSRAPVVTVIAKDRVLGHNPAAAIYSQYIRRQFGV